MGDLPNFWEAPTFLPNLDAHFLRERQEPRAVDLFPSERILNQVCDLRLDTRAPCHCAVAVSCDLTSLLVQRLDLRLDGFVFHWLPVPQQGSHLVVGLGVRLTVEPGQEPLLGPAEVSLGHFAETVEPLVLHCDRQVYARGA